MLLQSPSSAFSAWGVNSCFCKYKPGRLMLSQRTLYSICPNCSGVATNLIRILAAPSRCRCGSVFGFRISGFAGLACAFGLLGGSALDLSADDYSVRNYHMEEGLPDGEITCIAQTPDGYLWVGTPKGLARFDGMRFRVYLPRNTPELQHAGIASLLTDDAGRLWIGGVDGTMLRWSGGK